MHDAGRRGFVDGLQRGLHATYPAPDAHGSALACVCDSRCFASYGSAGYGRVPAGCGYCFGTSPKPSERGQSAGPHHARPVFKTPSMSLGLYLSTLSPSTPRSSTGPVLDCLWLWPWRHPMQEDCFQRPDMVGQASRNRRGTRPPQLGCAMTVRDFGS